MPQNLPAHSLSSRLKILFLGAIFLVVTGAIKGQSPSDVQVAVATLTAPHAALGAPITYRMVLTNNGTASTTVRGDLELIAPDGTRYPVLGQSYTIAAGKWTTLSGDITTNAFTSRLGNFTLHGYTSDPSSGTVFHEHETALNIVAVPAGGVYSSVGGLGPDSAPLGYTADYRTVATNLGTSNVTLTTNTTLILTDGTRKLLAKSAAKTYTPGASVVTVGSVTASQYSSAAGTFVVEVSVMNTTGQIVSLDTYNFARNVLPTDFYPPKFTDTAVSAGVGIVRSVVTIKGCGAGVSDQMNGGAGMAVADYDGDGWEDIYVVDMKGTGHLWRNEGNGTFTDKAASAGIPSLLRQSGASFADMNNDGRPDLLLMPAEGQMMLLKNLGNGTFTNVTAQSGLATTIDQNFVGATWGDYDNDGLLDLYVAVHVDCAQVNANDHLYHNNGNLNFTDVTNLLGGASGEQVNRRTLVPIFADYNGDGRVDLYCGNDVGKKFGPNVLWRNDGPGGPNGWIFTDVSVPTKANVTMSAMGIAVGDYARRGVFNFLVTNVRDNILLQRQDNGTFTQVQGNDIGEAHVSRPTVPPTGKSTVPSNAVTWNTAFYDFNNDGWEDLYLAGGPIGGKTINSNVFFLNNRDGTFLDLSILAGVTGVAGNMPGTSFADFDRDGFMDIFQAGAGNGVPHLYMNKAKTEGNPGHWLAVKLIGTASNRDAVGAHLVASVGGAQLHRWVINTGFQGNSSLIQHFGLGAATVVDSLTIYWPSGATQSVTGLAVDQQIALTE
ncbi:MAG: CRTAC1 family protein [Spartobacteria bacterium]